MVAVRTGSSDDVELARRAVAGEGEAFAELFDRWFDRAFDVAWHIVRNRDTAAEVAQETFATAWRQIATLRQPESFGGWILRIARNKGLNRLAVEQRARSVGDPETLVDHDRERRVADDPAEPVIDRERDDLVWAASAALGDADASLLSLHLRHGLDAVELAGELGIAANAAHQRMFRLKKRLGDAIGAWTLWQLGRPRCDALRELLTAAGTSRFDRDTAATITAHTRGCPDCHDRRTLALSPEAMFAATPLVAAAPAVKAQAAGALAAQGVPTPATPVTSATSATPATEPGATTTPADPDPGRRRRRPSRRTTMLATGAVLVGVAAVALATRSGDAPDLVAAPAETSTTVETSTTAVATTQPDAAPTTSTEPPSPTATPVTPPVPIVTPPPTTAPPPSPEPQDPDPPVVDSFGAAPLTTGNCADPAETLTTFTWTSTGTTSAQLGPSQGPTTPVDPTGNHTACAINASTWTLTATGPGGTTTATTTIP
jgi:RNA polymerase sigma factor (sigma-70 family)